MKVCGKAMSRITVESGSQLLEFSLALPILLLLAVGAWDFGSKIVMRQKMTDAAREGARVVVSNKLENSSACTASIPCTVVAAASDVQSYLTNAGMNASWITPDSPTSSTACSWTYQQSGTNGASLVINSAYAITYTPPGGSAILVPATQVTLSWPVTWEFKGMLFGSGAAPTTITTSFTMADMADVCGS